MDQQQWEAVKKIAAVVTSMADIQTRQAAQIEAIARALGLIGETEASGQPVAGMFTPDVAELERIFRLKPDIGGAE